jgi:3'-5' exoribonuclease 1
VARAVLPTVIGVNVIVVDVEATCWAEPRSRDRMEIIEIGAVRLDGELHIADEIDLFVRPVVEPRLSGLCTELTTITQADVDGADPFSMVFPSFLEWIGDGEHRLCTWGAYDVGQFRLDCRRHGLAFPEWFETEHLNLKTEFAAWQGVRRCGMAKALAHLGIPLEGIHHRGIDDARNIARIAQLLLADGR